MTKRYISLSLALLLFASCSPHRGIVENYLDALIAGRDASKYLVKGQTGLTNSASWEQIALDMVGSGKPQVLDYNILNTTGDVVTVNILMRKTRVNPIRGSDQHLFISEEVFETRQFEVKDGKISRIF